MSRQRSHMGSRDVDYQEVMVAGKKFSLTVYEDGAVSMYFDADGRFLIEQYYGAGSPREPQVGVVVIPAHR
jgi:hypothetical protein